MANQGEEDLVASKTEGFKLGDKKTVEEYAKLGEPRASGPSDSFIHSPESTLGLHISSFILLLTCLRPE